MNRVQCSICGAAMPGNRQDYPDYPFCSRRCRLADLGRWFGEEYRVPDAAPPDLSTPPDDE
ncbi:DNA gyrase inhibitor YacG [Gemmata sp.]|uniref:DNA gyrase inhibitor YacG n=1 Tax=Gemmata sp. TaxID=1914242 RepID=UPI003F71E8CB